MYAGSCVEIPEPGESRAKINLCQYDSIMYVLTQPLSEHPTTLMNAGRIGEMRTHPG